eukprot:TRINITY_DN21589_c0_g1_i1.p1 TRINITY_DN21589_c0_g1~~TRINITY_DN21589_c0_g1_i1.p1  ORF type:complete len:261 (+),score=52.99 TRINITY_DN21589_c0_g1_i1:43-783(+)
MSEPCDMVPSAQRAVKWQDYFNRGFAPWDSGKPSSQLEHFVETSPHWRSLADAAERAGRRISCCELGCGSGASTCWLAAKGFDSVGIDILEDAVEECRKRAAQTDGAAATRFMQGDVFDLDPALCYERTQASQQPASKVPEAQPGFDFVYDSQCFHVVRQHNEADAVRAIAQLLRPQGLLLVLTGNSKEPEAGPSVLSREELVGAFSSDDLFELLDLQEGRFDATSYYEKLPQRPLMWQAIFRRRC